MKSLIAFCLIIVGVAALLAGCQQGEPKKLDGPGSVSFARSYPARHLLPEDCNGGPRDYRNLSAPLPRVIKVTILPANESDKVSSGSISISDGTGPVTCRAVNRNGIADDSLPLAIAVITNGEATPLPSVNSQ